MPHYANNDSIFTRKPQPGVLNYDMLLREAAQMYSGGQYDLFAAAKVYIITPEALECVADAARRMKPGNYPIPQPPAVPLWLEFENGVLQMENWHVFAVFIAPDETRGSEHTHFTLKASMLIRQPGEEAAAYITLYFRPGSARWWVEWSGEDCTHSLCPVGRSIHSRQQTANTQRLWIPDDHPEEVQYRREAFLKQREIVAVGVMSEQGIVTEYGTLCPHWAMGEEWARLIASFFYLLEAQGVEQEIIVREGKPYHRPKHGKGERQPERPIQYRRISLTHQVHTVRRVDDEIVVEPAEETEDRSQWPTRTVAINVHPRLLIAATGKRWKQTQVVYVKAHERKVHVKNRVRYWVEE